MSRTAVVLHGGGGPATVATITSHLGENLEVFAPTHPGWDDTAPVPGDTISALAGRYLEQLSEKKVKDAVLVGSSVGGWIAAEMAIQDAGRHEADRVVGQLILIDSVGAEVPGAPLRDVFALTPRELAEFAWSDPELGFFDPATLPPERLTTMQGNMAALAATREALTRATPACSNGWEPSRAVPRPLGRRRQDGHGGVRKGCSCGASELEIRRRAKSRPPSAPRATAGDVQRYRRIPDCRHLTTSLLVNPKSCGRRVLNPVCEN